MAVPARLPPDEAERLAALHRYGILDTPAEECFDRIVKLAARRFDVPIALISLVDEHREWFKSRCGPVASEMERDVAFCAHAILADGVFVVPDASKDSRFADNPFIAGGPKIRFYAGAPLISPEGYKLGALCIIDGRLRPDFSARDEALLMDLAAIVVDEIEMRYAADGRLKELEQRFEEETGRAVAERQLGLFFDYVPVAVAMFDRNMRYIGASERWRETFDIADREIVGRSHYEIFPTLPEAWKAQYERCLQGESLEIEEDKLSKKDGGFHWVRRLLRPWRDGNGDIGGLIIFTEIIDERKNAETALERTNRFTEAVLDHIQDGVVACDADGRLSLFNKATRRFHGVDSEPIPPEKWAEKYDLYELDGETPLAMERIPLFRALGGEIVDAQEMVIAPRSGPARTIVASGTSMYSDEGEKLGAVVSMHDVTGERVAQEKWREANARYRAIFDQTFQFCGFLDRDGTMLEANETALKFGGFTRDDVVGKPFWKTPWWPEDKTTQETLKAAVRSALSGEFVRYEVDVWGEGRKRTPIDFSLKPVRDADGAVVNLIAEGRDVSDKRESEEALRRNQAELELILNNVPIRIFYKDDKNRIIRLNEPAARSMGVTVKDVEGKDAYELFPQLAKKYHDDDLEVINSGKPKLGIIEEYAPAQGARGWVRTDKVPYTDPESGERFVFAAALDITAEKTAEEALRSSEERYRLLYNNTPVMLHSIDRDGRLLSVSDFWLEKLQYSREEVIGRKATEFLTRASAKRAIEQDIPELMRTGSSKDIEYQILTKSGETLDILLSAVAEYDDDGKIKGLMGVLTDITERKVVERQLIQAQKMESVGQLTGGLAHDFNNLLGIIIGNLQLVERSLGEDEKAARRIGAAVKAGERGAELTRRLLAFSRRQKLETEIVDVNPLIEGLIDLLKRTLGEKINLECRLGDNAPGVRTDPAQLESAVLNLAVNARDAMPEGGTLTIETEAAHLDEIYVAREKDVAPGDYVFLAVTDTGCGIPPDKIEKVFEPFFTTKEVGKGSGLGLSMVYGFMKQTGGHVRIYSEVGRGTTVRLYLPADASTANTDPKRRHATVEDVGGQEKILVVEDQEEVRDVAVALLEDLGYSVLEAKNGREGLAMLQANDDIDLLFTDIVMPGRMDGVQLAKAARELRADLPIVFTSGYAEAAVLRKGEIKAARNLVTKPYRIGELASKIRFALDSQEAEKTIAAGAA